MNNPYDPEDEMEDAPQPPMPIDPSLADVAIARIRKQVQGNGLKPAAVNLTGINGQIYDFYGTTSVKLTPSVTEGRRAGRHADGDIIQAAQIDDAIQNFVDRVAGDRGVLGLVYETLSTREDQGFGLQGQTINLPQVTRTFLAHDACPTCRGAGGKPCHNCHGQMRIQCYRCHGQGGIPCLTCSGRGQILTPQGPQMCHVCQGRGLSQCPVCQGGRMIMCPECQGQGRKICESCQGQGWTTQYWTVGLTAQTVFHLRKTGLPAALVSLIDRVGGSRLAADGHAHVQLLTGRDAEHLVCFADIEGGSNLWFLYRAQIPFAELEIGFGKAVLKPKLAGYKARLIDVPDFMDALLKSGTDLLHDAARGGAGAAQLILSAARYRALGDVLRGLVRSGPRKMAKFLSDNYPLGLSQGMAAQILRDANTALSRLSLWPRMMAMGASLAVAFVILGSYFFYDGRTLVAQSMDTLPTLVVFVVDLLLMAALGMAGTFAIRATARKAMRGVLEGLGVVSGGNLPLPKPGVPGLWLWIGLVAMTATFVFVGGLLKF
ncbi:MAG TPA: hypothetical protein VIN59_02155 [Alphaproteobacteria bacterium]